MRCQCNGCANYYPWKAEKKLAADAKFAEWLAENRGETIHKAVFAQKPKEKKSFPLLSVSDWMRLRALSQRPDVAEVRSQVVKGESHVQ